MLEGDHRSGRGEARSTLTGAGCAAGRLPHNGVETARRSSMGGREGGKNNPAATVLAVRRTSGDELRRRPGRGGAWPGPRPAAERKPPVSPPRESDAGAVKQLVFTISVFSEQPYIAVLALCVGKPCRD
jgi:hypothetical protein